MNLRVVQSQVILFLKSMSVRGGSDIVEPDLIGDPNTPINVRMSYRLMDGPNMMRHQYHFPYENQ